MNKKTKRHIKEALWFAAFETFHGIFWLMGILALVAILGTV